MSIRLFEGVTWICGWFDAEGRLKDVQQYSDRDKAVRCARDMQVAGYETFVGAIQYGDSLDCEELVFGA